MNILQKGSSPLEQLPDDFILLIDKPLAWTSFDVVNKVRYLLSRRFAVASKKIKVGHAGTLDPLATGLLVLCVGKYTKNIETLQAISKTYTGIFTFGATTPSYDLEKPFDTFYPVDGLTDEKIQSLLPAFTGAILQAPPVFSAIKQEGKRVYKSARTGQAPEVPARPVFIEKFTIGPLRPVPGDSLVPAAIISKKGASIYLHPDHAGGLQTDFEVSCGKGTYIRSLAHDIGQALGSGAYLSTLRRTHSSGFSVDDAWNLKDFEAFMEAGHPAIPSKR